MLQVSDGWYTATADVIVNIDDVNDNAPQFEQHFYEVSISNSVQWHNTSRRHAVSWRPAPLALAFRV